MKKLNILIFMILGMLTTVSCESDRDSNPVLQDPATFVLNTPAYASTVYDLKHAKKVELTCSQPDYGFTAPVDYRVQVSLTGEFKEAANEETPATYQTLASVHHTAKMDVDASELAVAIVNLSGITEEEDFYTEPIKIYVRLQSSVNEGLKPAHSNVVELPKVLSYFALEPVVMPEKMYITGTISDWDWAKAYAMVPVYPKASGEFWIMQYFEANAEIKFNSEKSYNGAEFGFVDTVINDEANAGITDAGGNMKIATAGWYIVVVKTTIVGRSYTYAVEFVKPVIYLCGPTVGDKWGVDGLPFVNPETADGEFVSPAFPLGGDLRMCVVLTGHEWWHTEFIILDGKIEYRGNGEDQDRVAVETGKKAYLNFSKGTGRVE